MSTRWNKFKKEYPEIYAYLSGQASTSKELGKRLANLMLIVDTVPHIEAITPDTGTRALDTDTGDGGSDVEETTVSVYRNGNYDIECRENYYGRKGIIRFVVTAMGGDPIDVFDSIKGAIAYVDNEVNPQADSEATGDGGNVSVGSVSRALRNLGITYTEIYPTGDHAAIQVEAFGGLVDLLETLRDYGFTVTGQEETIQGKHGAYLRISDYTAAPQHDNETTGEYRVGKDTLLYGWHTVVRPDGTVIEQTTEWYAPSEVASILNTETAALRAENARLQSELDKARERIAVINKMLHEIHSDAKDLQGFIKGQDADDDHLANLLIRKISMVLDFNTD